MEKAVDFEKIRKRRQRFTTLKRVFILAGVVLLIVAAIILNNILVEESITTRLSDMIESFGGDGFPAQLPGGIVRDINNIGENITILNDTNLYILSPKAKTVSNIQRMNDTTIAIPSSTRVLTYSVGKKEFSVHSLSKELFSKSLDYGAMCGDMNDAGDFAIVAPVKQYPSTIWVYDNRFEEIYHWYSPEYVTQVSISPRGEMMAAACLTGDGGALKTKVYMFRFSEERESAAPVIELADQVCLQVNFLEQERILVLTDKQYLVLNSLGEKVYSYDFSGAQVLGIETRGRETLLLTREDGQKTQTLLLLDDKLQVKSAFSLPKKALDIALAKDFVYVLTTDGVDVYDPLLELKSTFEKRNISDIHLVDSKLYYLTPDEVCLLIQSDLKSAQGK